MPLSLSLSLSRSLPLSFSLADALSVSLFLSLSFSLSFSLAHLFDPATSLDVILFHVRGVGAVDGHRNGARAARLPDRDWYFIAEQPAPAPHLAHPEVERGHNSNAERLAPVGSGVNEVGTSTAARDCARLSAGCCFSAAHP